jgi:hypothetical protein
MIIITIPYGDSAYTLLNKSGSVGVWPVWVLRLEISTDLFSSTFRRHALTFKRKRPRANVWYQFSFCRLERTVLRSAVIGEDMLDV